jgi:hypothetical protein
MGIIDNILRLVDGAIAHHLSQKNRAGSPMSWCCPLSPAIFRSPSPCFGVRTNAKSGARSTAADHAPLDVRAISNMLFLLHPLYCSNLPFRAISRIGLILAALRVF